MPVSQVGDKYAHRNAQMGTIGLVLAEEYMPFADSGIIPDIIINDWINYENLIRAIKMETEAREVPPLLYIEDN